MSIEKQITDSLRESVETKQAFWTQSKDAFLTVGELLVRTVKTKNKVLIFGNGGSACDALHFAGEWVNRFQKDRPALSCFALTADAPLITCIGNDSSFDAIFERQIEAHGRPGDVAIGISTSGNSPNVIRGLKACPGLGVHRVALTGGSGGRILSEKAFDHTLHVGASKTTARIQETHEWILHSLCEFVDHELFG